MVADDKKEPTSHLEYRKLGLVVDPKADPSNSYWTLYLDEYAKLKRQVGIIETRVGSLEVEKINTLDIDTELASHKGTEQYGTLYNQKLAKLDADIEEARLLLALSKEMLNLQLKRDQQRDFKAIGAKKKEITDQSESLDIAVPGEKSTKKIQSLKDSQVKEVIVAIARLNLLLRTIGAEPTLKKNDSRINELPTYTVQIPHEPKPRTLIEYNGAAYRLQKDTYVLSDDKGNPFNREQQIYSLGQDGRKLVNYNDFPTLKAVGYTVMVIALVLAISAGLVLAAHTGGFSLFMAAVAWAKLTAVLGSVAAYTPLSTGVFTATTLAITSGSFAITAAVAGIKARNAPGRRESLEAIENFEKAMQARNALTKKEKVERHLHDNSDQEQLSMDSELWQNFNTEYDKLVNLWRISEINYPKLKNDKLASAHSKVERLKTEKDLSEIHLLIGLKKDLLKELDKLRADNTNVRGKISLGDAESHQIVEEVTAALARMNLISVRYNEVDERELDKQPLTFNGHTKDYYFNHENGQIYEKDANGNYILCDDETGQPYNHKQQLQALAQQAKNLQGYGQYPRARNIAYIVAGVCLVLVVGAMVVGAVPTAGLSLMPAAIAWSGLVGLLGTTGAYVALGSLTGALLGVFAGAVIKGYRTERTPSTGQAKLVEEFITSIKKQDQRIQVEEANIHLDLTQYRQEEKYFATLLGEPTFLFESSDHEDVSSDLSTSESSVASIDLDPWRSIDSVSSKHSNGALPVERVQGKHEILLNLLKDFHAASVIAMMEILDSTDVEKSQKALNELTDTMARVRLIYRYETLGGIISPEKIASGNYDEDKKLYIVDGNFYEEEVYSNAEEEITKSYFLCDANGIRYDHEKQLQTLAQDARKIAGHSEFPYLRTAAYSIAAIALLLVAVAGVAAAFHTDGTSLLVTATAWTQLGALVAGFTALPGIGAYTAGLLATATVAVPVAGAAAVGGYLAGGGKPSSGPAKAVENFIAEVEKSQLGEKLQNRSRTSSTSRHSIFKSPRTSIESTSSSDYESARSSEGNRDDNPLSSRRPK